MQFWSQFYPFYRQKLTIGLFYFSSSSISNLCSTKFKSIQPNLKLWQWFLPILFRDNCCFGPKAPSRAGRAPIALHRIWKEGHRVPLTFSYFLFLSYIPALRIMFYVGSFILLLYMKKLVGCVQYYTTLNTFWLPFHFLYICSRIVQWMQSYDLWLYFCLTMIV